MRTILIAASLVLVFALGLSQYASAYYDDTHYSLTYYLARTVGYTPEQAHRIASADIRIDYATPTEPNQYRNVAIGPSNTAQRPRVLFHAFMDEFKYPRCQTDPVQKQKAITDIGKQGDELYKTALETKNLGAYLHFMQDSWSHTGYGSWGGHWASVTAANRNLPMGSYTDWLSSYTPKRHMPMITQTVQKMQEFMAAKDPVQYAHYRTAGATADLKLALDALILANPYPKTKQPTGVIPDVRIRDTNAKTAYSAVNKLLKQKGDKGSFSYSPIGYSFNADGTLRKGKKADPYSDEWTLWGRLDFDVKKPEGAGKVTVVLKSVPTMKGDQPYEIKKLPLFGDRATFLTVPVGRVLAEVSAPGCVTVEKTFVVKKLENKGTPIILEKDSRSGKLHVGKGPLIGMVPVPANKPDAVYSTQVLDADQYYVIEASGAFSCWSDHTDGVDAYYCDAVWRVGPKPEAWQQLLLDDLPMYEIAKGNGDSVDYNPGHKYTTYIKGTGKPLKLQIGDAKAGSYGDNVGSLKVGIYQGIVTPEIAMGRQL